MYQQLFVILMLAWQGPNQNSQAVPTIIPPTVNALGSGPTLRCGAESLYLGLKLLELPVANFPALESKLGAPSGLGYSMAQLETAARSFGANALGVKTTLDNLARRPERTVAIAHMSSKHFVTVIGEKDGMVELINPPAREISIPKSTFLQLWDGKALLLSTNPILKEEDLPGPFPWRLIIGVSVGALLTLAIIFGMSFRKATV